MSEDDGARLEELENGVADLAEECARLGGENRALTAALIGTFLVAKANDALRESIVRELERAAAHSLANSPSEPAQESLAATAHMLLLALEDPAAIEAERTGRHGKHGSGSGPPGTQD